MPLSRAMQAYNITTKKRIAMFLAQIGHESGRLRYTKELWGPTKQQQRYEPPSGLARGLGNIHPGDGHRYAGHGLIQTTGRNNHRIVTKRLRAKFSQMDVPDFEDNPELLCQPEWACLSACDYWDMRGLNELADADDFLKITKRINGGTNGLADRKLLHSRAVSVLMGAPVSLSQLSVPPPSSQPVMFFS